MTDVGGSFQRYGPQHADRTARTVNNIGGEFTPHTPAQFGEFLVTDVAGWQKVVARIGFKLD